MKKNFAQILLLSSVAFGQAAFAHPGHDHGHWLSEPIHLLSLLAVAGLTAAGYAAYRRAKNHKLKDKQG